MKDREPQLKAPKELLSRTAYSGKWLEITFPSSKEDNDDIACNAAVLVSSITERFRNPQYKEFCYRTCSGMWEAITNANYHGNKEDSSKLIKVTNWYGQNGLVFAVVDEGDFYTKEENKKLIELQTELPSTRLRPSGAGLGLIYEAGRPYISTEQNAIFVACLVDNN